ncbi:hypothetical protein P5673_027328 [Acropora cervicornis]|uniref:Uncharacterized protein n=1 Tax=Acropora cervicornis TaxID=6130 RepID=A0AAD9PZ19_ACRCE|nr:hypothetical protein P5673_027328 [Acropora cervicornis]
MSGRSSEQDRQSATGTEDTPTSNISKRREAVKPKGASSRNKTISPAIKRIQRELAEITLEPPPNCRYILSETRRQSFIFGIKKNKQNNRNAVFVALNRTFCKTAIKISDEAKAAQNCT